MRLAPQQRPPPPTPPHKGEGSAPSARSDDHIDHQLRLKPALRLFERSPLAVSLTEPVTLNGPPNSFCSALSVRSHLSSGLEMSAPNDPLGAVGRILNRSRVLAGPAGGWAARFGVRTGHRHAVLQRQRGVLVNRHGTAQRRAELALLLCGVDARLDRGLVPAERGLETGRGDGGPGNAGRLIRHGTGEQLLRLEGRRWNGGLAVIDAD